MDGVASQAATRNSITSGTAMGAAGAVAGSALFGAYGGIGWIINSHRRGAASLGAAAAAGAAAGVAIDSTAGRALTGMAVGAAAAGAIAYGAQIPGSRSDLMVIAGASAMFGAIAGTLGAIVVRDND